MGNDTSPRDLTTEIGEHLPYLRRYARSLSGNQTSGDMYAAATLEAILADPSVIDAQMDSKKALFKVLHGIWQTSGMTVGGGNGTAVEQAASKHLARLTDHSREALLLHTIEEFPFGDIAEIMDIDQKEAEGLVRIAHSEMADSVAGKVLIIEDEPIIALDIETLVTDLGHRVTAVARTRDEAVEKGHAEKPDLILADIRLADNSSGIDAVNDLLADFGELPVVFITAYPERLLTGDRPEPAFLISKPYTDEQVTSAVSQAMFFSSTATLK